MFCSKCGNKLNDGVKFCSQCGNKIEALLNTAANADELKEEVKAVAEEIKEEVKEDIKEETAEIIEEVVPVESVASIIEEAEEIKEEIKEEVKEEESKVEIPQIELPKQVELPKEVETKVEEKVQEVVKTEPQVAPTVVVETPVVQEAPKAEKKKEKKTKEKKAKKKHAIWPCYLFSPVFAILILAAALSVTLLIGVGKLTSKDTIEDTISNVEVEKLPASMVFANADDGEKLTDHIIDAIDKKYPLGDKKAAKKELEKLIQTPSVQKALGEQFESTVKKMKKGKGTLDVDTDAIIKIIEDNEDIVNETLGFDVTSELDNIRASIDEYNENAVSVKSVYKEQKVDTVVVRNVLSKDSVYIAIGVLAGLVLLLLILNIHHLKVAFMNLTIMGGVYSGAMIYLGFNVRTLTKKFVPNIDTMEFLLKNIRKILADFFKTSGYIGVIVSVVCLLFWIIFGAVEKSAKKKSLAENSSAN